MNLVQETAKGFGADPFTIDDLADTVAREHPDVHAKRVAAAWRGWVRGQLRKGTGGDALPFALSIDDHGTYRQLSFMDVGEYRFAIRRYMRQSRQSRSVAFALLDECRRVHGVTLDMAEVLAS
jgi:hypothetical protein